MSMSRRGGDRVRVTAGESPRRTGGADTWAVPPDPREDGEWCPGHASTAVHVPPSRLIAGTAPPATAPHPAVGARGNSGVRGNGGQAI